MSSGTTKEIPKEERFHHESSEGVDAVLERMCKAIDRHPDVGGYAQALDVSPNTIKTWTRRGAVPMRYLTGFAREHGISLEYLKYGRGAVHIEPGPHVSISERGDYRVTREESAPTQAPPTVAGPPPEWRDVAEMYLDVALAAAGLPKDLTGRAALDMIDKMYALRRTGVKLTAEVMESMLEDFIKGRS